MTTVPLKKILWGLIVFIPSVLYAVGSYDVTNINRRNLVYAQEIRPSINPLMNTLLRINASITVKTQGGPTSNVKQCTGIVLNSYTIITNASCVVDVDDNKPYSGIKLKRTVIQSIAIAVPDSQSLEPIVFNHNESEINLFRRYPYHHFPFVLLYHYYNLIQKFSTTWYVNNQNEKSMTENDIVKINFPSVIYQKFRPNLAILTLRNDIYNNINGISGLHITTPSKDFVITDYPLHSTRVLAGFGGDVHIPEVQSDIGILKYIVDGTLSYGSNLFYYETYYPVKHGDYGSAIIDIDSTGTEVNVLGILSYVVAVPYNSNLYYKPYGSYVPAVYTSYYIRLSPLQGWINNVRYRQEINDGGLTCDLIKSNICG